MTARYERLPPRDQRPTIGRCTRHPAQRQANLPFVAGAALVRSAY